MLKGTKTENNLKTAFAGESQAYTKYQYYASKAKKEGYIQISNLFLETANNEKEHAKIWFKILNEGCIPDTIENLQDCIDGEHFEWTDMYRKFAEEAKDEGFDEIAYLFESISEIEKEHEKRYKILLKNLKEDKVFKKDKTIQWQCSNCGHTYSGDYAMNTCPVCSHPQGYFEEKAENYK